MKKLLSLFSSVNLLLILSTNVIACERPTNPIPPSIQKTDLSTIHELTGLNLTANVSKNFKDLDNTIATTAEQFKNKWPLFGKLGFQIKYYISKNDNYNIADNKQTAGIFWIMIKVASCDIYWKGQTTKLQIILN